MTELSSLNLSHHYISNLPSDSLSSRLHIPKHVLGQEHPIELPRIRDHDHRRRIHQLVIKLELWVLLLHDFRHRFPPQSRGRKDIRLVDGVHGERRIRGECDLACDASDALYFGDGVDRRVPCYSFCIRLLPVPKV